MLILFCTLLLDTIRRFCVKNLFVSFYGLSNAFFTFLTVTLLIRIATFVVLIFFSDWIKNSENFEFFLSFIIIIPNTFYIFVFFYVSAVFLINYSRSVVKISEDITLIEEEGLLITRLA